MPDRQHELRNKQQRLATFLDRHDLDGVLLTHRNNFAWVTCGRVNRIANNTPGGVATIYATRDALACLANTIEAPRMRGEELAGAGIEVIDFPWYDGDARTRVVRELIGDRKVATDSEDFGLPLPKLPGGFNALRWSLTPEEMSRYQDGARRASLAMEAACRSLKRGDNELEAAGLLDHHLHRAGLNPVVTLVASDDRIEKFRHPIPVDKKIQRYVMLVTCAEHTGLISCLTRFVHFGPVPAELKAKQRAIANIDAAVNLATKPGRTLGEVFADLQKAYADHGHADQWKLHHQGGSTGYNARDVVGTPGSSVKVLENQAFAWNPSVVGVKSEDTVLCTPGGIEVLTAPSAEWPQTTAEYDGQSLRRPEMLVA